MSSPALSSCPLNPQFDRLRQADVAQEPFPHLLVPGFLPADTLSAVLRDFPALDMGGLFLPENARGALADLIEALEGQVMRDILGEKLAVDLSNTTTLVTIRDRCEARDGRIHADSSFKLATALLYLNGPWASPEGRLRILRSPTDIEDYALEIPPDGGLLACFRVQKNSWHGHKPFVDPRRYVMLNYCDRSATRRREAARHFLSGKLKRVRRLLART
jgi:SM-20-related protein